MIMSKSNRPAPRDVHTEIVRDVLDETLEFEEWIGIAGAHSRGNIWLTGSYIYGNVADVLYGGVQKSQPIDLDFLVEEFEREVERPRGWEQELPRHGNLVFVKPDRTCKISINSLQNFHSLVRRNLPPNIRHFYTGTPLDVQSLTYDCGDKGLNWRGGTLYGQRSINAIVRRRVGVNDFEEAKYEAKGKVISLERYIKQKAEELGFDYSLPENPTTLLREAQTRSTN